MALLKLVLALAATQAWSLPAGDALSLVQHKPFLEHPRFQAGSRVEVLVPRPDKEGTWVPATVAQTKMVGFYDVDLELGPGDRYSATMPGIGADAVRKPLDTPGWEESKTYYIKNPAAARQVIEHARLDTRRRMQSLLYARGLTKPQVGRKMVEWDKAQKVKQEADARWQGCPRGYKAVNGDGRGNDQFGRGDNLKRETIDLCMKDCEQQPKCRSFEWSPRLNVCNLNKVSEPDRKENFMDFIYCQRLATIGDQMVKKKGQ